MEIIFRLIFFLATIGFILLLTKLSRELPINRRLDIITFFLIINLLAIMQVSNRSDNEHSSLEYKFNETNLLIKKELPRIDKNLEFFNSSLMPSAFKNRK